MTAAIWSGERWSRQATGTPSRPVQPRSVSSRAATAAMSLVATVASRRSAVLARKNTPWSRIGASCRRKFSMKNGMRSDR